LAVLRQGDWYIVACPRAASPFDATEQEPPYPNRYVRNMLLLADMLKTRARGFRLRGERPLALRVGISHGEAAGAVIGSHKSFYCLYGDTVNTAARMCKYAAPDQIHCSAAFAEYVLRLGMPSFRCTSRGLTEVKGKGVMETFDITLEAEAYRLASLAAEGSRVWSRAASAASEKASRRLSIRDYFFAHESSTGNVALAVDDLSLKGRAWALDPRHRIGADFVFRDRECVCPPPNPNPPPPPTRFPPRRRAPPRVAGCARGNLPVS
jgi:hypothetical protein